MVWLTTTELEGLQIAAEAVIASGDTVTAIQIKQLPEDENGESQNSARIHLSRIAETTDWFNPFDVYMAGRFKF